MWSLFLLVYFLSSSFRRVAAAAKGTVNLDKNLPRKQVIGVWYFSFTKNTALLVLPYKTCLVLAVFLHEKDQTS